METITISVNKMTIVIALVAGLIIGWAVGFGAGRHNEYRRNGNCGFPWSTRYEQNYRARGTMMNTRTPSSTPIQIQTETKTWNTTSPVKPTIVTPVNTQTSTVSKQ